MVPLPSKIDMDTLSTSTEASSISDVVLSRFDFTILSILKERMSAPIAAITIRPKSA
jgi:hypothetical protein